MVYVGESLAIIAFGIVAITHEMQIKSVSPRPLSGRSTDSTNSLLREEEFEDERILTIVSVVQLVTFSVECIGHV